MKIGKYHTHWLADCWPLLSEAELKALAEDIKSRGLKHPIVLTRGKTEDLILDGRNRAMACELAGIEPDFTHFQGTEEELLREVMSQNHHTRKTTPSQNAMAVALMYRELESRLKKKTSTRRGAKTHKKGPGAPNMISVKEIAQIHQVGERTLKRANAVLERGTELLAKAIQDGKVDLRATDKILKLDPDDQDRLVFGVNETGLSAAQVFRRQHPKEARKGGHEPKKSPRDVVKPKNWKLSEPWAPGFKKSWTQAEMVQGHLREAMANFRRLERELTKQAKKNGSPKAEYDFRQELEKLGSSITTGLNRVDFMFVVDHCECGHVEECRRCHGHGIVRKPFKDAPGPADA